MLSLNEMKTNQKQIQKTLDKKYNQLVDEWTKAIESAYLGKTITTIAMKEKDAHTWREHTISNISEVIKNGKFGTEITVRDENGVLYTLSSKA